jgi:hypothetical protein
MAFVMEFSPETNEEYQLGQNWGCWAGAREDNHNVIETAWRAMREVVIWPGSREGDELAFPKLKKLAVRKSR